MAIKLSAIAVTCLMMLSGAGLAADRGAPNIPMADWHWIWSFTTYDPTGHDSHIRSWDSAQGVVRFAIHNGRFTTMLDGGKDKLSLLIKGQIRGHQATATIYVQDTDDPPQHFKGAVDSDFGAERISMISSEGEFVGLITQAPPNLVLHGSK